MLFGRKKKLERALEALITVNENLNKELSQAKTDVAHMQRLLDFVDRKVQAEQFRLCKLQKMETGEYIAYLLQTQLEESPQYMYTYNLFAYLDSDLRSPVYRAHFSWRLPQPLPESTLDIDMQYIENGGWHGCGIGSCGMDIVKTVARELHCTKITAKPKVLTFVQTQEETKKELEKLLRFYEKNGFQYLPDTGLMACKVPYTVADEPKMF